MYHYKQRHRHTCWSAFAAMNKDGGIFPRLGVVDSGTLLSSPSKANIETYCSHTFRRVSTCETLVNSRCCCCYSVSWEWKVQNSREDAKHFLALYMFGMSGEATALESYLQQVAREISFSGCDVPAGEDDHRQSHVYCLHPWGVRAHHFVGRSTIRQVEQHSSSAVRVSSVLLCTSRSV